MHIHIDRIFETVSRNLGLSTYHNYTDSWIEWSYEAEKLIGSKETFVQKEITYTSSGAKATGNIIFSENPSAGDNISLNGLELFFRNSTDIGEGRAPEEIRIKQNFVDTLSDTIINPYGLIQKLQGYTNTSTSPKSGKIMSSPLFHYPELLNVATYSLSVTTGDDMITNGAFTGITQAQNTTGTEWTTTDDWTIGSGTASHASGTAGYLRQTGLTFVEGETYMIQFDISSWTAGELLLANHLPDTTGTNDDNLTITTDASSGDTVTRYWKQGSSETTRLSLWASSGFDGSIDNIVVKKVTKVTLTITAKEIGFEGNKYTLSSNNENAKISGLNLTGGKEIYRNQQLILPEDNVKLLAVRVGKDDSTYENSELRKTTTVHRERVGWNNDDSQQRAFRYYVDGNRVNIQHDDFDEITVVYLAYPTDVRGWPMIREGHETAVAQYIMWQMKLIEFYNGKLPQYITKELEKRWYFLCGKARGDDSMPTSEELSQIGKMWNTLIPVKSTRGLIDF